MKNRKKLTAMILSGVLIFSQGSAAWAGEEMAGGIGSDMIVEKDAAPQIMQRMPALSRAVSTSAFQTSFQPSSL